MRRAIVADFGALSGVEVRFTLDARFRAVRGSVAIGPGQEPRRFAALARESDAVLVIAPESGGILARREGRLRALGVPSLGCEPKAIALAGDKLACVNWLGKNGVRVVPTRRYLGGCTWPRPLVIKPRRGAGSIETYLLVNDATPWPRLMGPGVVQPFVSGVAMSAAAIVSKNGRVDWIGTATQDVAIRGGRFAYRGGEASGGLPVELRKSLTKAVAAWRGLAGWVGIDYMWEPETRLATVLEVNPRLTTSYIGQRQAMGLGGGAWLAALWLHAVGLGRHPGRRPESYGRVRFRADGRILSQIT